MASDRYVAERIIWYLNGTLDENERAEVERLLADSKENRAELSETLEAARLFGHRLPADIVVDYAFDGSHEEVPSELIERHLAASPLARAEYELVRESRQALERDADSRSLPDGVAAFPTPAAAGWRRLALAASLVGATALGLAGWQWSALSERGAQLAEMEDRLQEALDAETAATATAPVEGSEEAATGLTERIEELEAENVQLAAGKSDLVEQVERQSEQLRELGEQVAVLEAPQANLAVVDLYPGDMVLRGEPQSERVVAVARDTKSVALILNSGLGADDSVTGMRIVDAEKKVIWASDERPQRDELGTYTVSMPVDRIAPGRYAIELLDESGSEVRLLESYLVEIR